MDKPTPPERKAEMQRLFAKYDYLTAYRMFTDWFVERDPQGAVGSQWEELGQLQIEYMLAQGMKPEHRLLDFGCGTLRAGRHFIRYLDAGRYTGVDLSLGALEYGKSLVAEEGLADKHPRLIQNTDIATVSYGAASFDFIMAQSVFTHLRLPEIGECLKSFASVMHPGTRLFFTYNEAPEATETTLKDFKFPFEAIADRAREHGILAERRDDYGHPRGQLMAEGRLSV